MKCSYNTAAQVEEKVEYPLCSKYLDLLLNFESINLMTENWFSSFILLNKIN